MEPIARCKSLTTLAPLGWGEGKQMAFDNYLPLTKVVLPMNENENETVAKPKTKKRQSTWAFLYDCRLFVAGQLGIARHQLQNEESPHLCKIYEENVKERENLLAEIEDRMKTANARDGDDYTPLF